jgi:hypothetical protein
MDATEIADRPAANLPDKPTHNGKVTLMTFADLDGRTLAARRARQLVGAIEDDLGGDLTVSQRQLATNAAILGAMIESMSARWLQGGTVDLASYALLINAQRRCLAAL